jgi:hypothetical protein
MTIEHDDVDIEWSAEIDPVNAALLPLIEYIFLVTADGSCERVKAMGEVLECAARIKQVFAPKPRLQ